MRIWQHDIFKLCNNRSKHYLEAYKIPKTAFVGCMYPGKNYELCKKQVPIYNSSSFQKYVPKGLQFVIAIYFYLQVAKALPNILH